MKPNIKIVTNTWQTLTWNLNPSLCSSVVCCILGNWAGGGGCQFNWQVKLISSKLYVKLWVKMEELGNYQIRIVNRKPLYEQETGCTEGIRTCMSFLTTGRSLHITVHQSIMKFPRGDHLKMISVSVADPGFCILRCCILDRLESIF